MAIIDWWLINGQLRVTSLDWLIELVLCVRTWLNRFYFPGVIDVYLLIKLLHRLTLSHLEISIGQFDKCKNGN